MQAILKKIAEHVPLSRGEAERAMTLLLKGESSTEQTAGFLLGLRARGETLDELTGFTHVMRSHAVSVDAPENALDIVGTGGDGIGTFNISTAAAFVCAGAGAVVAKHGNRSVSSKCGSAEVLEELGVNTRLGKAGVEFCLREAGMAFLYAPLFHPAMANVMPVRRALGVRTCFNILGPMCNPAGVKRYMVGAFSTELAERMAGILASLGAHSAVTVHSSDGLDEVSISGPSNIFSVDPSDGSVSKATIEPGDVGLERAPLEAVLGGDAHENAEIIQSVLQGAKGPHRDIVVLNAGVALFAGGLAASPREGAVHAAESVDSGRAREKLFALVAASREAPAYQGQGTARS